MPQIIEQYTEHKRSNLYNQLIFAAISIEDGSNKSSCSKGLQQITQLTPDLQKQSAKGWRRMYAELWIGQLAMSCGERAMANGFLDSALKNSKKIYQENSTGQQLIVQRVELLKH